MVDIAPFVGHEYNPDVVDRAKTVSPPFDTITPSLLKLLRESSPYNVVHLTLHDGKLEDAPIDPHQGADILLEQWIDQGILQATSRRVLYAYECVYAWRGEARTMRGILAALRLDPEYQSVIPHEEIFAKPSEARVKLLRATGTDLEPIQLLYPGRNAETSLWAYVDGSQRKPDLVAHDPDGAEHRYWRIEDPHVIGALQKSFKGLKTYIADGHHRYAAALKYAQERREFEHRPPRDAPWDYKVCLLVNMNDAGVAILPTHRVVHRAGAGKPADWLRKWKRRFTVREISIQGQDPLRHVAREIESSAATHAVGAWMGDPDKAYVLETDEALVPESLAPGRSAAYRGLGVTFLQHLVLAEGMDIPEDRWGEDVSYTRDEKEAETLVAEGEAVAAFVHQPVRMKQLRAIADARDKMPPKATFFSPKTLSGVVYYRIGKAAGPPKKPRITS